MKHWGWSFTATLVVLFLFIHHRPTVSVSYESMEFYGTSEFWYTMRDVLRLSGDYKAKSFRTAASDYCQTAWRVLMDRFVKKLYTFADHYRLR